MKLSALSPIFFAIFWSTSIYAQSKFAQDYKFKDDPVFGKHKCQVLEDLNYDLDKKYPLLAKCFPNTSLYFSTLHQTCDPNCLPVAMEASKFIKDSCKSGIPTKEASLFNNRHLVYSVWSDPTAANVICAKKGGRSSNCLMELTRAQVIIENAKAIAGSSPFQLNRTDRDKVCIECNKLIYDRFIKTPYELPMVYYMIILNPEVLLADIGRTCFTSSPLKIIKN